MDLLSDSSDGSDSDVEDAAVQDGLGGPRLHTDVGRRLDLPQFSGECLGDDMSWKGSKPLRVVCLQCGSIGRDRYQWGLWHAQSLSCLGADVGLLSETSLCTPAQHASAAKGMAAAGYTVVSHGPPDSSAAPPSAAGVLLAVRSGYAGSWQSVATDTCGRAIAATLVATNGETVRFLAVYGPVGACLHGFTSPVHLDAEHNLKLFLDAQIDQAVSAQCLLIVGGDLNSFCSAQLDRWGGSYLVRPECVAVHLGNRGLLDTFRLRHPGLRAFTFFSHAQSASRLDALWLLPAATLEAHVLNSAIVWNWPRRADHAPVMLDLSLHLPLIPNAQPRLSPWKSLVARLDKDLPDFIKSSVLAHSSELRALESVFHRIQEDWFSLPPVGSEGLDGFLGVPSPALSPDSYRVLGDSFNRLMQILSACLPEPTRHANRISCRTADSWCECLAALRQVRHSLLDHVASTPSDHVDLRLFPLHEPWALWEEASRLDAPRINTAQTGSASNHTPISSWDYFHSDPVRWALSLGFDESVASTAPQLLSPAPSQGSPAVSVPNPVSWHSVPDPSRASPARCAQLLSDWIIEAGRRQSAASKRQFVSFRQQRLHLLRSGDKAWAARMRPSTGPSLRYTPTWVTDADGSRRRPSCSLDVLTGARQEWGRLLQEPNTCWSHDAVSLFSTPASTRRGAINFPALAQAPPNSQLHLVGSTLLAPGPWCLIHVSAPQVHFLSETQLRLGDWVLSFRNGEWWAQLPAPCSGPLRLVLSAHDIPGRHLSPDFFRWPPPSAVLCTRCWEEPSSDLVGPTTPAERAALIAKLRNSRPGPSGWKLCFIEAFPAWVQEIYWLSLDVQRLVGCLAPSLNLAEQVHLPKPAGGWRPLSMLEESFKAIEAPVVRRLGSARSPWVPDVPFSSLNRAYVRGVSAAAEVLYTDTLVCEDSYRHQLPLLRVPADFEKFFNTLQLPLIDAMQQGRGFPDAVRRLHQALFASACVCLDTRVGLTPPLPVTRGLPQGAVSSPELSRVAQEPILRIRASDGAAYHSSGGRRVVATGYVDDIEHYGSGLKDLPAILNSLALGSRATGVGYAWSKFSAFASDWDEVPS